MFLASVFVRFEGLDLLAIHMLCNLVCLPLLERETESFVTVILIIRLILVIFHTYEVAVYSFGVEGECHESINCSSLWDDLEGPGLYGVSGEMRMRNSVCSPVRS